MDYVNGIRKGMRKQVIWLEAQVMKDLQRMCFETNTNLSVVLSQIVTVAVNTAVDAHDRNAEEVAHD